MERCSHSVLIRWESLLFNEVSKFGRSTTPQAAKKKVKRKKDGGVEEIRDEIRGYSRIHEANVDTEHVCEAFECA
jgi:hypothetical protein